MWDHARIQGHEDKAISPEVARVVFENDQIDGRPDVYTCRVIWQSPSSLLDATLLELNRRVDHTAPLDIAPANVPLSVASGTTKGTKLAVLGHPQGGNLSIGVLGSLDEMQGTLVDRGPRANAENPVFLHYMTPTEPGNSGSPVFEADEEAPAWCHEMSKYPYKPRRWGVTTRPLGFNPIFGRPSPRVTYVARGSPADQAGLQVKDEILGVNGRMAIGEKSFHDLLEKIPKGGTAKVAVMRKGEQKEFVMTPRD